jgi:hypothetical protein
MRKKASKKEKKRLRREESLEKGKMCREKGG